MYAAGNKNIIVWAQDKYVYCGVRGDIHKICCKKEDLALSEEKRGREVGKVVPEKTCRNENCPFRREEKCTLSGRGEPLRGPQDAECLQDIMEMERQRFTG